MSRIVATVPISTGMHRPDRFDDGPDPSELPDLPIPRPGEGPAEPAQQHQPIAPPRLGGGASFTAASEDDPPLPPPEPTPIPEDVELIEVDRARLETERFTWEIAARLTAGMLANPDRNHSSVKDAMAMFDQFLHEMHAYAKIASEFDITGDGDRERRRRDHSEYFRDLNDRSVATEGRQRRPVPLPDQLTQAKVQLQGKQLQQQGQQQQGQQQGQQPQGQQPQAQPGDARPEPSQPAPAAGYQPLPPGARGLYVPGSMAGAPPDPSGDLDEDVA